VTGIQLDTPPGKFLGWSIYERVRYCVRELAKAGWQTRGVNLPPDAYDVIECYSSIPAYSNAFAFDAEGLIMVALSMRISCRLQPGDSKAANFYCRNFETRDSGHFWVLLCE
jgi:hypothetical protein